MHVTTQGEELGTEQWDNMEDAHLQDYNDVDEFEEWLLGGGAGEDDDDYEDEEENMSDADMEDAVGHES